MVMKLFLLFGVFCLTFAQNTDAEEFSSSDAEDKSIDNFGKLKRARVDKIKLLAKELIELETDFVQQLHEYFEYTNVPITSSKFEYSFSILNTMLKAIINGTDNKQYKLRSLADDDKRIKRMEHLKADLLDGLHKLKSREELSSVVQWMLTRKVQKE